MDSANSEIRYCPLPGGPLPGTWDIYRDGRFVTTEPGEDAASSTLAALEACKWAYLDHFSSGLSPLELVQKVERAHGRITWQLGRFPCGRLLFRGGLGGGEQFSYQLFDQQLADQIVHILRPQPHLVVVAAAVAREPADVEAATVANDGAGRERAAAVKEGAATASLPVKSRSGAPHKAAQEQPVQMTMF